MAHSGRLVSMCNTTYIEKVELTLPVIDNTDINRETIRQIVTENLGIKEVSAKMIPKNLTSDQKLKLGPHDAWFVFVMCHASRFAHRVYEKCV